MNHRLLRQKIQIKSIMLVFTLVLMLFLSLPMVYTGSTVWAQRQFTEITDYDYLPWTTRTNCVAFARYKVPSMPTGLTGANKRSLINSYTPKAGAVAIYSYQHVSYVESVNGSRITTLDGGIVYPKKHPKEGQFTGHIARISGTQSELSIIGYWIPGGGAGNSGNSGGGATITPVKKPSFTDTKVQSVGHTNAVVFTRIQNPAYQKVEKVGCKLYKNGSLVKDYTENCGLTTSYVNYTCDFNVDMKYTLSPGTTYTFQQYAIINGVTYTNTTGSFKTGGNADNVSPTIKLNSISYYEDGKIHIYFEMNDDQKLDGNGFSMDAWTSKGEKDDLKTTTYDFTYTKESDKHWTNCHAWVKITDHNSEKGNYNIVLNMKDSNGNKVSRALNNIYVGDYRYELENGVIKSCGYGGNSSSVTLPIKIGDYTVKNFNSSGTGYNITNLTFESGYYEIPTVNSFQNLKKIVVPEGVEVTGRIEWCEELTQLILPSSLKKIEQISYNKKLSILEFPSGLEEIGRIDGMDQITQLNLPSALKKMDTIASMNGLTEIIFPEGMEEIPSFISCSNLEKIYIPASACEIGTISGCPKLKTIEIDERNPYFTHRDGFLMDKEETELYYYTGSGPVVDIPSTICTIKTGAFPSETRAGTVVRVPYGVETIEKFAFSRKFMLNVDTLFIPSTVTGDFSCSYDDYKAKVGEPLRLEATINNDSFRVYTAEDSAFDDAMKSRDMSQLYIDYKKSPSFDNSRIIYDGLVDLKRMSFSENRLVISEPGESEEIELSLTPSSIDANLISIKSDNTKIAAVTNDGTVIGIKPGTTTLTAEAEVQGELKTCTIEVIVRNNAPNATDISAAQTVTEQIESISDDIYWSDDIREQVFSARQAYEQLTSEQKGLVKSSAYSKLLSAEARLEELDPRTDEEKEAEDQQNPPNPSCDHSWDTTYTLDTDATCKEEGKESIHCKKCDAVKEGSTRAIAKKAHSYGAWKTTKAATYTSAGTKERTCAVCGSKEQSSIARLTRISIAKASITKITNKTYTGKNLTQAPIIKVGGKTLNVGADYKLTYKNNKKIGKATVTITGVGAYTGTVNKTFLINPKGTTLTKVTATKKGFTANWKKQPTQTTGYQIQYSTNKSFKSGNKVITISKNKTVSKKVVKLSAKKKYYVRVRTYKTVSGKKYYSAWSKSKDVLTKK